MFVKEHFRLFIILSLLYSSVANSQNIVPILIQFLYKMSWLELTFI